MSQCYELKRELNSLRRPKERWCCMRDLSSGVGSTAVALNALCGIAPVFIALVRIPTRLPRRVEGGLEFNVHCNACPDEGAASASL
jgi:hypothetical protein